MLLFVFEARLFKLTYREPSFEELFQLPPTMPSRPGETRLVPLPHPMKL